MHIDLKETVKEAKKGPIGFRINVPGKWTVSKEPDGTIRVQIFS